MNAGVEQILTLTFGKGGNETTHLGNGWSGDEPGSRWMLGPGSEIWLEHPGQGHDLILELDIGGMDGPKGDGPKGDGPKGDGPKGDGPEGAAPQRLVVGARNRGIAQISVTQGGNLGFHIPAALIVEPGPVRLLFVHPDFRRPVDLGRGTDDRQLSFSARSLRLFRLLPRPAPTPGPPLPFNQMIMGFESLGDNCEFGLVQRQLQAEPLGLLRFSFIELPLLLRGLRSGFEGLGEPDTVEVNVVGQDREFVVRESVYGMTYHTFQYEAQMSLDAVRQQQAGYRRRGKDLRAQALAGAAARGGASGLRDPERDGPQLAAVDGASRCGTSRGECGNSVAGSDARLHRPVRAVGGRP
jgi:hypothetical protein